MGTKDPIDPLRRPASREEDHAMRPWKPRRARVGEEDIEERASPDLVPVNADTDVDLDTCLLYTSPSPRDGTK